MADAKAAPVISQDMTEEGAPGTKGLKTGV